MVDKNARWMGLVLRYFLRENTMVKRVNLL
jgi:hypothetical protein